MVEVAASILFGNFIYDTMNHNTNAATGTNYTLKNIRVPNNSAIQTINGLNTRAPSTGNNNGANNATQT